MKEKEKLKKFLLREFLIILFWIAVSQLLLSILYDVWIIPALQRNMDWNIFNVSNLSGGLLSNLFSAALWFVVQGLLMVIPRIFSDPLRSFLTEYWQDNFRMSIHSYFPEHSPVMSVLYYFGCLMIILILLFILLLPFLLGAWWFSRRVDGQVKIIIADEKRQQEEFEEKKNLMLSDVAHDLKTPITTIGGYAQALSQHIVPEERKQEYLNAICSKSDHMNQLIILLFEYVRLGSGKFHLERKSEDVAELLRENVAALYMDFEKKQIEIEMDIPEGEVPFMIDRIQFSRAVTNLLTNTIKHNQQGDRVIVRFWQMPYSDNWCIMIADNGVQISDSIAEHIFEPFVVGDESRSSKGGSGLGMSIAYKIMQMHGWPLVLDTQSTPEYTKAFTILLTEQ